MHKSNFKKYSKVSKNYTKNHTRHSKCLDYKKKKKFQCQGALKNIFKTLKFINYPKLIKYSKCDFEKSYFPLENIHFNILYVK